jgi:1-acyl-sn-glycerol-3-phosphate acyltransferase
MKSVPVPVNPWLYWALFPAHQIVMRAYFRQIQIQGRQHLPPRGPIVFACKHFSRWDPLVLYFALQKPLYFMTDANQFGGVQGWVMRHMGAFPVNRDKPEASSIKTTIAILAQSQRLVIFPEGGIVRDQPLRPLKPGLARIVLQAEASTQMTIPIVPIGLQYFPDAVRGARVQVKIGAAIVSQDCRAVGERAIARELTQILDDRLRRMVMSDREPTLTA